MRLEIRGNVSRALSAMGEFRAILIGHRDEELRVLAALPRIEALWEFFWARYYHDDLCESHGDVEDVFV